MYSYIVRRLAFGALTVLGVSLIVFMVLRVLPGDPLIASRPVVAWNMIAVVLDSLSVPAHLRFGRRERDGA